MEHRRHLFPLTLALDFGGPTMNRPLLLLLFLVSACGAKAHHWAPTPALPSAPLLAEAPVEEHPPEVLDEAAVIELVRAKRLDEALAESVRACEADPGPGCMLLGDAFGAGIAGPGRDREAAMMYERSCKARHVPGCRRFAESLRDGKGTKKDAPRALEILVAACDANDASACGSAGLMLRFGQGVPKDVARGFELGVAGCVGGDFHSCSNLGHAFRTGDGVAVDVEKARELYGIACSNRVGIGCHNLAYLVGEGIGLPKDPARAALLRQRACELGYAKACELIAEEARGHQNPESARRPCEDAPSCEKLGSLLEGEQAASVYDRACVLGLARACAALAAGRLPLGRFPGSFSEARGAAERAFALDPGQVLILAHVLTDDGASLAETRRGLSLYTERCVPGGPMDPCNGAAWTLATSPHSAVRNGKKAVHFAKRAYGAARTRAEKAAALDTLAAAQAAAGKVTEAARLAKKAVAELRRLAPGDAWASSVLEEATRRLHMYRRGAAFFRRPLAQNEALAKR